SLGGWAFRGAGAACEWAVADRESVFGFLGVGEDRVGARHASTYFAGMVTRICWFGGFWSTSGSDVLSRFTAWVGGELGATEKLRDRVDASVGIGTITGVPAGTARVGKIVGFVFVPTDKYPPDAGTIRRPSGVIE